MPDITYDCIPCDRPSDAELRTCTPERAVPEELGWYAQFWYGADGTPKFERRTHGNYTDRWYRLVPAAPRPS